MAESLMVRIEYALPEELPCLAAQQMTIRQALLILLTAAIRCVPGGRVCIRVEDERWGESIIIWALRGSAISASLGKEHLATLDVARELVSLSNGSLVVMADDRAEEPFAARLTLPVFEQVPVLVVDDNVDALQLYRHYLAGSRYQFIGLCDPQELFTTIERRDPQVIVLDVMLPGIDGWELLGCLRAHPKTSHVPVIVCTILPQQQLASSLGAAGFLSKPVTRQELLAALDQQLALLSKRCR
jgi:CheY-like chemotaxis protein